MTDEQFQAHRMRRTRARHEQADAKALEYARADDRLHNFKQSARRHGITPESALAVHMEKHVESILNVVRRLNEGEVLLAIESAITEPIAGRIDDLANYLDLLDALLYERRSTESDRCT